MWLDLRSFFLQGSSCNRIALSGSIDFNTRSVVKPNWLSTNSLFSGSIRVPGYQFNNYHKVLRCNLYTKLPKY